VEIEGRARTYGTHLQVIKIVGAPTFSEWNETGWRRFAMPLPAVNRRGIPHFADSVRNDGWWVVPRGDGRGRS